MKIVVGIPCMGTIHAETVGSLIQLLISYKDIDFRPLIIANSLVYDARNSIVNYAIQENADYLLFVDSDIIFPYTALGTLLNQNKGIVSGVYWSRSETVRKPIIYDSIKPRRIFRRIPKLSSLKRKIQGCEEVKACGMGFCLIRKDALRKMVKHFISPFEPYKGLGEDIAFCYRAGKVNEKIYAIECGLQHIGKKRYQVEWESINEE